MDVDGKLWEEIEELKNRFLFTLEIIGRIVVSPFKAMTVEAGAGIGIGADIEANINGVPVEVGASSIHTFQKIAHAVLWIHHLETKANARQTRIYHQSIQHTDFL